MIAPAASARPTTETECIKVHSECVSPSSRTPVRSAQPQEMLGAGPGPFRASLLREMSAVRSFLSIPMFLLAMAGLAGCYDLSAPSGPRREDFMGDPGASEPRPRAQQQNEQAEAQRSEQAAMAATKATVASDPATDPRGIRSDATAVTPPPGADLSVAEYVARYIHPAPSSD